MPLTLSTNTKLNPTKQRNCVQYIVLAYDKNELTFYIMTKILTALSFIVRLFASSTSKFVNH